MLKTTAGTRGRELRKGQKCNPYKFTNKLLGDKKSRRLQCPKREVEDHLKKTQRPTPRTGFGRISTPQPSEHQEEFDMMEPRLIEVKDIIRKAQAESAPGPGLGGIPYQVYKNCPRLPTRLCKLLRVVWKKERKRWRA